MLLAPFYGAALLLSWKFYPTTSAIETPAYNVKNTQGL